MPLSFPGQKFQCAVGAGVGSWRPPEIPHGSSDKRTDIPRKASGSGLRHPSRTPAFSLRVAKGLQSQKNISHTDPPDGIFFSLKLPGDPSFPFLAPLRQVAVSACDKHFLKLFGRAFLCIIAGSLSARSSSLDAEAKESKNAPPNTLLSPGDNYKRSPPAASLPVFSF